MPYRVPDRAALGIFAKRPDAGRVKTRLIGELGPERAARLAELLLLDAADAWAGEGGRRVIAYDPEDAGPWFDARVPSSFALRPQATGDLGERMAAFFQDEFEDGATRVVLIGCDSPTLDPAFVASAFLLLEHKDIVLGPATDGGYYLIGCRRPLVPSLFEGIAWGTPDVLAQTVRRVRAAGRSLAVLPPWYDVDTPDDLRMLAGHLAARRLAGHDALVTRVERLLLGETPEEAGA
jgi:rSAM/selenodomain-associated transferase 1